MNQINFIGSESVVNRTSPEKFFILGDHTCVNNAAFLTVATLKKIVLIQKNKEVSIHSNFLPNILKLCQKKFQQESITKH